MKPILAILGALIVGCGTKGAKGWTVSRETDSFSGKASAILSVMSEEQNARLTLSCDDNNRQNVSLQQVLGIFNAEGDYPFSTISMRYRINDGQPISKTWHGSQSRRLAFIWEKGEVPDFANISKIAVELNLYGDVRPTATFLIPNQQAVVAWGSETRCTH